MLEVQFLANDGWMQWCRQLRILVRGFGGGNLESRIEYSR